jgi:hypothetical protein
MADVDRIMSFVLYVGEKQTGKDIMAMLPEVLAVIVC